MTQEALKLALEALQFAYNHCDSDWVQDEKINPAITAIKEALAQPEQEPVACKECHLKDTVYDLLGDLKVANLKLSVRAKRTWVGLAAEDRLTAKYMQDAPDGIEAVIDYIEAKLKEKNT